MATNVFINPVEEFNKGYYGPKDKELEYARGRSALLTEALQREETQAYLDYMRGMRTPGGAPGATATPYAEGLTPAGRRLAEGKAAAAGGRAAPRMTGVLPEMRGSDPFSPRGDYRLPATVGELFGPAPTPVANVPASPAGAMPAAPRFDEDVPWYLQPVLDRANRRAEAERAAPTAGVAMPPANWAPTVAELFRPPPPLAPGYLEQAGFRMFGTAPDPYIAGQPGVTLPAAAYAANNAPPPLTDRIRPMPESVSLDPFDPASVKPIYLPPPPPLTAMSEAYDALPPAPPPPPQYRGDYQPPFTPRGAPNVPAIPLTPEYGVGGQPPPNILPAMPPPYRLPTVYPVEQPTYPIAAQPTYAPPGPQPGYAVLGQPGYAPPGPQPVYAAPAQPTYAPPAVQPTYAPPGPQPTYTPLPLPPEYLSFYMMLPSVLREHFLRTTGYTDPITGKPPLPLAKFTRNELGLMGNDDASVMANRAALSAGR